MKRKVVISGILAVSMIIAMSCSLASALVYSFPLGYVVNPNGNVWQLRTESAIPTFSGKDVDPTTVTAKIYDTATTYITVTPNRVVLTDKLIMLIFNPASIPDTAYSTSVTGSLTDGNTFFATGPGFTLRSPGPT